MRLRVSYRGFCGYLLVVLAYCENDSDSHLNCHPQLHYVNFVCSRCLLLNAHDRTTKSSRTSDLYFSNYVTRLGKPSFQYLLLFLRTKWHILIRNTNIAPFFIQFCSSRRSRDAFFSLLTKKSRFRTARYKLPNYFVLVALVADANLCEHSLHPVLRP